MKKVHAVLFSLLMITMSLAGCIGGDGDDGDKGDDGVDGTDGIDGTHAIDGTSREDGMSTLIATSPEPEGVNCPNSGTKIDAGLDVNGNGALDSEEIGSTDYICDGGSSINNMLTSIVQTDDSLECTAGSKTIAHGLDNGDDSGIPANGIMETGEIDTRITECSKYSPGIFAMQYPSEAGDPSVNNLIVYNNELYFEMFNNLWKTDGTTLGTMPLTNSSDGPYDPSDLAVFNGELYFSARDINDGKELWKTDGTESGTQKVIDLANGTDSWFGNPCGSSPKDLVVLGDKLVFHTGSFGCFHSELYATDGTENGTIRLADTCDECDDNINSMHVFNGELFFSAAYETGYNNELWKTDGTPDGTVMVKEINPGSGNNGLCSSSYMAHRICKGFIELDNYLYFLADSGTGQELWKTDGTNFNTMKVEIESATVKVESAPGYNFPGINESTIGSIYATDDRIIITSLLKYGGLNPNYNGSVWAYDPIANNVTLIFGDDVSGTDSVIQDFFSYGNRLFFEADSGITYFWSWAPDQGISPLNQPMEEFNFEEYLIDDDKIYLRMYCQKVECREYDGGWLIYNMSSNTRESFVNNDNPHTDYDAYQLTKFNDQIFFMLRDRAGGSYDHLGSFDAHISTEIIMQ